METTVCSDVGFNGSIVVVEEVNIPYKVLKHYSIKGKKYISQDLFEFLYCICLYYNLQALNSEI